MHEQLALTFGNQALNISNNIPHGGLAYMQNLLSNTMTIFILAGAFLMVIYIVWAGMQWITSGGDKQKLSAARGRLTWAVIGFIILMVSAAIINAIGYLFQVNLLKLA